jgi:hypothetical protein
VEAESGQSEKTGILNSVVDSFLGGGGSHLDRKRTSKIIKHHKHFKQNTVYFAFFFSTGNQKKILFCLWLFASQFVLCNVTFISQFFPCRQFRVDFANCWEDGINRERGEAVSGKFLVDSGDFLFKPSLGGRIDEIGAL